MEMTPQHLPTNIHSFVFTGSQKLKVSQLEKEPWISAGVDDNNTFFRPVLSTHVMST